MKLEGWRFEMGVLGGCCGGTCLAVSRLMIIVGVRRLSAGVLIEKRFSIPEIHPCVGGVTLCSVKAENVSGNAYGKVFS